MRVSYVMIQWIGLFLFLGMTCTHAQSNVAEGIRVAKFKGDRAAAISYTFDDGLKDQADLAVPMLEEFGFRGTFFIITGRVCETDEQVAALKHGAWGGITWAKLKEMSAKGHEIANHTVTHKHFILSKEMTDELAREEINKADQAILEKTGIFPMTFCFPGNGSNQHYRDMVLENHVAARVGQKFFGGTDFTTEIANAWADELIAKKASDRAMIHGILVGYKPFTSMEVFRDHLVYVKKNEDKIWVDTFANVARYEKERDAAELKVISQTEGETTFALNCSLKRPPYDYPLTVVIPVSGVTKAEVVSKDGATTKAIVTILPDKILIDSIPSPEPVTIRWSK